MTLLHQAAFYGRVDVARYLLEQRHAHPNPCSHDGCTPLLSAVLEDHVDVVICLLRNGAAVDALDTYGCTPLHDAVTNGRMDCARALLFHGTVYAYNRTCLLMFIECVFGVSSLTR